MKVALLTLAPVLFLVACCSPIDTRRAAERSEIVARVGDLLALENRFTGIRKVVTVLKAMGELPAATRFALDGALDVYWIYYSGANVALANEEYLLFAEFIDLASKELDGMEDLVKDIPVPQKNRSL